MQEKEREISPIKARILQYLCLKGITKYSLYKDSGISRGILDQGTGISEDNLYRFLKYAQDISPAWLITGDGFMLKEDISNEDIRNTSQPTCTDNCVETQETRHNNDQSIFDTKTPEYVVNNIDHINDHNIDHERKLQNKWSTESPESPADDRPGVQYKLTTRGYGFAAEPRAEYKTARDFSLRTDSPIDMQRVPLYDLNASAGLVGLFIDSSHQAPVDYISIPGLPRCDGAVHVCGDSMYPLLKSGDIVIYKEVNDIINNIFWGEMYMVSFDVDGEEYIAIKYVQRSDDSEYIRLVSYNTHHSPQDIKLSRVRALAIIKASVRFNTMG